MRGRWYRWNKKDTTEELLNLDMLPFAKSVDLTRRRLGSWHWTWSSGRESSINYTVQPGEGVRLSYTVNKQREYNYVVAITSTPQRLGGVRWWWLCPQCGQRVRILYCSALFVCRRCAGVYYETQQNKSLMVRTDNQLYRIRRKLKAKGGGVADSMPPPKPKGMHWTTYSRLAKRWVALQQVRDWAFCAEACGLGLPGIAAGQASKMAAQASGEWQEMKRVKRKGTV